MLRADVSLANFYPRPPRGGRLLDAEVATTFSAISIHALREEGDYFTITPKTNEMVFLSTPSARRATMLPVI